MAKTVIQLDSIRHKVHTKAVADILPLSARSITIDSKVQLSARHGVKTECKIKNFVPLFFVFFPPRKTKRNPWLLFKSRFSKWGKRMLC